MCDGKRKCIRCVTIGSVLLGLVLLLAGCWSTEEPPTASEVEGYLRDIYGEEFHVIEQESLPAHLNYVDIEAYRAYPASNPEIEFYTYFSVSAGQWRCAARVYHCCMAVV